jgi:hypothetical protein
LPVNLSNIKFTEVTFPACENMSCMSCSIVWYGRLPTNNRVGFMG